MLWARNKAVAHRVHPTMLHMGIKVSLVADVMFPKTAMPNATLLSFDV